MYKLTYASDEDITAPADDTKSRKSEKTRTRSNATNDETGHEKQRFSYSDYRSNSIEEKEATKSASKTTPSYKSKKMESQKRQNAYSFFGNDSSTDTPIKSHSSHGVTSGIKTCLLIFYLLGLTAGVVMLLIMHNNLIAENRNLMNRLHVLEKRTQSGLSKYSLDDVSVDSLSLEISPPVERQQPPPVPPYSADARKRFSTFPNADINPVLPLCCTEYKEDISDLKLQVAANQNEISEIQKSSNELRSAFDNSSADFSKLMENFFNELSNSLSVQTTMDSDISELKLANDIQKKELDQFVTKSNNPYENSRTIAFDAYGATNPAFTNTHEAATTDMFEVMKHLVTDSPITYQHERINRKMDIKKDTGIFIAPYSGIYAFLVSFCTRKHSPIHTTVSLMQNHLPIRNFPIRISTKPQDPFLDEPPKSFAASSQSGAFNLDNVMKSDFQVIAEVIAGDKIYTKLKEGSIVETTDQACTRFSGFRVR